MCHESPAINQSWMVLVSVEKGAFKHSDVAMAANLGGTRSFFPLYLFFNSPPLPVRPPELLTSLWTLLESPSQVSVPWLDHVDNLLYIAATLTITCSTMLAMRGMWPNAGEGTQGESNTKRLSGRTKFVLEKKNSELWFLYGGVRGAKHKKGGKIQVKLVLRKNSRKFFTWPKKVSEKLKGRPWKGGDTIGVFILLLVPPSTFIGAKGPVEGKSEKHHLYTYRSLSSFFPHHLHGNSAPIVSASELESHPLMS